MFKFSGSLLSMSFCLAMAGAAAAQSPGDTLLSITYESGTTNSGITGIEASDAAAPDAAYMVSPGAAGNYAVAHKVVHGDSAYYSDGNWRSESSTISVARFYPGEERRYEFSLLLKDWPDWVSPEPNTRSNIFQCRVTGDSYVPVMVRIQRNALQLRRADASTATIVPDIRPYMNQWMHFRIDVLWAMDNTGYIKSYTRLPGQAAYSLSSQVSNIRTYTGDTSATSTSGKFGYIKWGVYGVPAGVTGIAYHDDIRILKRSETALPARFGNVQASRTGSTVKINWQTLSETSNSYFELQLSKDGNNFTTVKTIQSKKGDSSVPQQYESTIAGADMAALLGLPLMLGLLGPGLYYRRNKRSALFVMIAMIAALTVSCSKYNEPIVSGDGDKIYLRIKQVDIDGNTTFSKIVSVLPDNQ